MAAENFNHWGDLAAALPEVLDLVVDKATLDAERSVKEQITENGQVDTGNMRAGIASLTSKSNTYPGEATRDVLPLSVDRPAAGEHVGYVIAAAGYALYQDQGTRYLPARPFMQPGLERTRPGFEKALDALSSEWARKAGCPE